LDDQWYRLLHLGPGDRIKKARELEGYKYSQKEGLNTGTELRTGNSDAALEYLDCSEFVCRVLADDGITDGVKQMSTAELVDFLGDDDKFIRSDDEPQPGDVFLWRDGDESHTGIVVSYDKSTGDVVTSEARGEKWGSGEFTRKLTVFKGHGAAWKGFFRPKKENPDKQQISKHESSQEKFNRLMKAAEEAIRRSQKAMKEIQNEK